MLFIAKWSSSTFALFDVMHFQEFYILMCWSHLRILDFCDTSKAFSYKAEHESIFLGLGKDDFYIESQWQEILKCKNGHKKQHA